jgi:hypothetical protein
MGAAQLPWENMREVVPVKGCPHAPVLTSGPCLGQNMR